MTGGCRRASISRWGSGMGEHVLEDRVAYQVSAVPGGRPAVVLFLLHGRGGTRADWDLRGQFHRELEAALGPEGSGRVLVVLPEGHLSEADRAARRAPGRDQLAARLRAVAEAVRPR